MLPDSLLVSVGQLRVALAHNFAHAQLRQLFRQGVFFIEQPAFQRNFVLQKTGNHFVQVLLADAGGLGAFGYCQPVDLHMNLASVLVHPHVVATVFVATLTVIKTVFGASIFGGELIARG